MKRGRSKIPEERNRDRLDDLKSENKKLRKEIQQLRKQLNRTFHREEQLDELFEEVNIDLHENNEKLLKPTCPKCGSADISVIEKLRNDLDYYFCQNSTCNARGPINGKNSK